MAVVAMVEGEKELVKRLPRNLSTVVEFHGELATQQRALAQHNNYRKYKMACTTLHNRHTTFSSAAATMLCCCFPALFSVIAELSCSRCFGFRHRPSLSSHTYVAPPSRGGIR